MIHVGLDVHHSNSMVRAMTEDGELFPARRIHHDHLDALWQYLARFGDQSKRVVFEATANARWMRRCLQADPSITPVAVTPHKVRIIADTVAKTDKIDATVLASLSRMDALPEAWLPDEEVEELRELTRHRTDLVRQRTLAKNQINAALIRRGLLRPYKDVFGVRGLAWLRETALPAAVRQQVDHWLEGLDLLQRQIARVEGTLYRDLARRRRWIDEMALLTTMPNVGRLTALTILAELGQWQRFASRGAVAAFAGLVPVSKRSDRSARYGRLSKRGPSGLRRILVLVARGAARRSLRYGRLYERLKRGKGANKAKTAVARQLLEDAWTMLRKGEPFRDVAEQAESLTRAGWPS